MYIHSHFSYSNVKIYYFTAVPILCIAVAIELMTFTQNTLHPMLLYLRGTPLQAGVRPRAQHNSHADCFQCSPTDMGFATTMFYWDRYDRKGVCDMYRKRIT